MITEVDFTADELAALSDQIQTLARTEDLPAHADSIAARESIAP
jgi:histidinol dehydrogenase